MKSAVAAALGGYAGIVTLALGHLALTAATPPATKLIDVERINIREPDGTLRHAIASHARMPGIIIAGHETPHPNRPEAGMIFYNDEGTENGGLVFDGRRRDGRATNGGSLTFDRWQQDQTVQIASNEDGPRRSAGVTVIDRPDRPLDFDRATAVRAMPPGPARDAAIRDGGFTFAKRAFVGRQEDGDATLVLRDGAGRPRLTLGVTQAGAARIEFRDAQGKHHPHHRRYAMIGLPDCCIAAMTTA